MTYDDPEGSRDADAPNPASPPWLQFANPTPDDASDEPSPTRGSGALSADALGDDLPEDSPQSRFADAQYAEPHSSGPQSSGAQGSGLQGPSPFATPQYSPDQYSPDQYAPDQYAQPNQQFAPPQYSPGQPGPGQSGPGQPAPDQFAQPLYAPNPYPAGPQGPGPQNPGPQIPGPHNAGPQYGDPRYGGMPGATQPGGPGLDEVALIRKARRAPSRGWRRAVHTLSAGAINPGEAPSDIQYQQLLERVNRPVRGDYRIAVLSLKGGVGKTTTTVGLGSTFASLRGDRVIAVDANPDLGTLAQRIPQQTRSTVRDLLADDNVYRYSDVRAHTSQAPSRLEVLASERDPAMAEAFNEEEYRGVIRILQRFYNIIITDCGTGLSHSAMNGVLDLANAIILVSSPALDGARSAGATLDWLEAHGFGHLVSRAVVVLSASRPGSSTIDTEQLGQHFLTRCRAVHTVPFDDHLSEGADVDLDLVGKQTRRSFVELAATIADDFSGTNMRRDEPFLG
ncbi:AAA family ATPase [Gordonia soli]|uniref:AAA domain-containing protein n=1 Tax=Gordonia soli NBRC 108243 TaxID=1223545 RepID=M0QD20_9ACTN|nr:AAA family ATPase [Gordonia soli]GAC66221.1 hypothetical protein GS4_01_00220 [Gordonia soli NBRC 108243]